MKTEERRPRSAEMSEKGYIYMATAKREKNGFKLEVDVDGLSTSEAVEVAAAVLYSTVEQVCTHKSETVDPLELLIAELEIREQQDKFRNKMMRRMEDQLGPKPESMSHGELDRLLQGLSMAMKLKRDLGL